MIEEFVKVYDRDLERLKQEISAFNLDSNIWKTAGHVKNSSGNLSLHLIGNLNNYIGKNMGNYAYIRDRDAEFNLKNVPKSHLIHQIEEVKEKVISTLKKMDNGMLDQDHVEKVFGHTMTNGYFLIHLAGHLSYHLGQINYLRRVLE